MLIYWVLFGFFAAGALVARPDQPGVRSRHPLLILGAVLTAILIGIRYKVGADWPTYDFMFHYAGEASLDRVLQLGDPAYEVVNWTVQQFGGAIWLVNLICGAIFSWGLLRFCKTQPDPWLAFAIAIPYLVIVVAMGYTRQAVALGILMAGLAAFERGGSTLRFALYVAVAALFHKTAVVAFPLVALASPRNRFLNLLIAIAASIALYDMFLGDAMDTVHPALHQDRIFLAGGGDRVAMNLVAAIAFWLAGRRMQFSANRMETVAELLARGGRLPDLAAGPAIVDGGRPDVSLRHAASDRGPVANSTGLELFVRRARGGRRLSGIGRIRLAQLRPARAFLGALPILPLLRGVG